MKKVYTVKTNHDGIIGVYTNFKKALERACKSAQIEFTYSLYRKAVKRSYWYDMDFDAQDLYISIQRFFLNS